MKRPRTTLLVLPLLASVLLLPSCDSATNPLVENLRFTGTIPFHGQETLFFETVATGAVRTEFLKLGRPEFPDGDNVIIGFGFGKRNPGDLELCAVTFQTTAAENSVDVIRLTQGSQCLVLTEGGLIGEDRVIEYELTVTDSK